MQIHGFTLITHLTFYFHHNSFLVINLDSWVGIGNESGPIILKLE